MACAVARRDNDGHLWYRVCAAQLWRDKDEHPARTVLRPISVHPA